VLDDAPGVGDRLVVDVEHRDVRLAGEIVDRGPVAARQAHRPVVDVVAA
jgi:hypothetical protein